VEDLLQPADFGVTVQLPSSQSLCFDVRPLYGLGTRSFVRFDFRFVVSGRILRVILLPGLVSSHAATTVFLRSQSSIPA